METTIIAIVIAILGSNALWEFVRWLIDRRDSKKQSPERLMLKALGEEKLGKKLRNWLHSDVRTADDWRIIEALYEGYKALGGNGEIKKLYEEAKQIPTTE